MNSFESILTESTVQYNNNNNGNNVDYDMGNNGLNQQENEQIVDGNIILLLPKEVWIYILGYLKEKDLLSCSFVNSFLYSISQDNFLWKPLYLKKWNVITIPHRKTISSVLKSNNISAGSSSPSISSCAISSTNSPTQAFNLFGGNNISCGNFGREQTLNEIQQQKYYSYKLSSNNNYFIYKIYKPKLFTFEISPSNSNQNFQNFQNSKMFWKYLYKERNEIVRDGGIEEFYQLISTLIAFPLDFNTKAMMTMYTIVFQLCIMNYKIKNYYLPPLDLYRMLVESCHNYLLKLLNDSIFIPDGPNLIQYYIYHWQNFLHAIKRLNIVFRYFHRDWISKQHDEMSNLRPFSTIGNINGTNNLQGATWWKKLLNQEPSTTHSAVHLTTMMARGWIAVFFLGLQVNESFNDLNQSSNEMNINEDIQMDAPNRLVNSIQSCKNENDIHLIFKLLISITQLQEFLMFNGDDIPNLSQNQNILGNQNLYPDLNIKSPLFTNSNLVSLLENSPHIHCNEEMNKVAKKCCSFLSNNANN